MEKIPATAAAAPAAASASRGGWVRSSSRLWGVPRVWRRARERRLVRRFGVCFLLPVLVRARSRARGVPRDGFGVWGGGDRASL